LSFTSGLALINEERYASFLGQGNGLAFSEMQFWGKAINQGAVPYRNTLYPC
jgi:hypothetical protein